MQRNPLVTTRNAKRKTAPSATSYLKILVGPQPEQRR